MTSSESESLLHGGSNRESHLDNGCVDTESSWNFKSRKQLRRFLNSKYGHYAVLLLVTLDIGCIFTDFLISLYVCDRSCGRSASTSRTLPKAQEALGIVSLVFSCLFMLELVASIWAFGLRWVE